MALKTLEANDLLVKKVTYKMKHQWILSINEIPAYTVRDFKRPDINFQPVEINYINGKIYQAGKAEFGTTSMRLQEPVAPSVSQKVMTLINRQYDWSTGRMGYPDTYKIDFNLMELSGPGTVISEWKFEGAYLESVDFDQLTYDDSSPTEIQCTWRFDYAYLLY